MVLDVRFLSFLVYLFIYYFIEYHLPVHEKHRVLEKPGILSKFYYLHAVPVRRCK